MEIRRRLPYNDVYTRGEWAKRSRSYWIDSTGLGLNMYITVFLGCLVGTLVGVLPGVGPLGPGREEHEGDERAGDTGPQRPARLRPFAERGHGRRLCPAYLSFRRVLPRSL